MSCIPGLAPYEVLQQRECEQLSVLPLDQAGRQELTASYLAHYGKLLVLEHLSSVGTAV